MALKTSFAEKNWGFLLGMMHPGSTQLVETSPPQLLLAACTSSSSQSSAGAAEETAIRDGVSVDEAHVCPAAVVVHVQSKVGSVVDEGGAAGKGGA